MEVQKVDAVQNGITDKENKDLQPQIKEFLDVIAECITVVIIRERPVQVPKDMTGVKKLRI